MASGQKHQTYDLAFVFLNALASCYILVCLQILIVPKQFQWVDVVVVIVIVFVGDTAYFVAVVFIVIIIIDQVLAGIIGVFGDIAAMLLLLPHVSP